MSTTATRVRLSRPLLPNRSSHRRHRAPGLLAGALVTALVLSTGAAYLLTRGPVWEAQGSLLVLPRATAAGPDTVASLYDTLSQGEVPATYAELLRARQRPGDGVSVQLVPQTMVISVTAERGSATSAESAAGETLARGQRYLSGLATPYDVSVVAEPTGTAARVGAGLTTLAAAVLFAALVAGVAVQQLVQQVGRLRSRPPTH